MDRVEERTLPQLTRDLAVLLSDLFRQEVKLARVEAVDAARGLGVGLALCGAALILAIAAAVVFAGFVATALAGVMPGWAATLVTAVLFAALAGALAANGIKRINAKQMALPRTAAQLRNDLNLIREQTNS